MNYWMSKFVTGTVNGKLFNQTSEARLLLIHLQIFHKSMPVCLCIPNALMWSNLTPPSLVSAEVCPDPYCVLDLCSCHAPLSRSWKSLSHTFLPTQCWVTRRLVTSGGTRQLPACSGDSTDRSERLTVTLVCSPPACFVELLPGQQVHRSA